MESDDSDDWGDNNSNHSSDLNNSGNSGGGGDWADFSALDASLLSPPTALAATGRFEPGQLGQAEDHQQSGALEPVVFEAFADFAAFDEIVPPLPPSASQEEAGDAALFEEDRL